MLERQAIVGFVNAPGRHFRDSSQARSEIAMIPLFCRAVIHAATMGSLRSVRCLMDHISRVVKLAAGNVEAHALERMVSQAYGRAAYEAVCADQEEDGAILVLLMGSHASIKEVGSSESESILSYLRVPLS